MIEMANNGYDHKLMAVLTAKLCLSLSFEATCRWCSNFLAKVHCVGPFSKSHNLHHSKDSANIFSKDNICSHISLYLMEI